MKDFKGTITEQNLLKAFADESMARAKYTCFAGQARKDGYMQIAQIFEETAHNEQEHGEVWFKLLNNGIGSTKENLEIAANNENREWTDMYASYAKQAREDNLEEIAALFEAVGKIEKVHEARYRKLLEGINTGETFSRADEEHWECMNCGHIHSTKDAPLVCPVCKHPRSYFMIQPTNF